MIMRYDSRDVKSGDVFLALPGLTVDGRAFMQQALANGASKIYYEATDNQFALPHTTVPLLPIHNLAQHQGDIAAEFYDFPSRDLTMIGITGTNGKTSVSHFIAQCLPKTAVLGTIGYGALSQLKKSDHTTPMAADVQRILREFVDERLTTVAMEVSSHALEQYRVAGVEFDIAVFTNLSQDHLDFHGDMLHYANAKKKLFDYPNLTTAVVNIDDSIGREIADEHRADYSLLTYSVQGKADICVLNLKPVSHGFLADVQTPWGQAQFNMPLLGAFNIANCLAVIGVLGSLGVSLTEMVARIAHLKSAPGRMDVITLPGKPTVIVDFAHTPDALEKTLIAVREHCQGKLYCVFGCGGNRDAGKRPLMGAIASHLCDHVIVTNDNPRHEEPRVIAQAIAAAVATDKLMAVILDRKQAIAYAIQAASVDDIILIAGKGHEDYQIVGDEVLAFSDAVVVRELL